MCYCIYSAHMFTNSIPTAPERSTMNASKTSQKTSPVLRLAALLATPLIPDDYIELVNPLWTHKALRARVEAVTAETADSASITLQPGLRWQSFRAGQFVRVGVDIEGVRHWRCYSISSAPERADGRISITVKAVDGGRVSTHLVRNLKVGSLLELAAADGEFVWPANNGDATLLITAGSGITPVMSQLRSADARNAMPTATLLHYAPTPDDVIFRDELLELAARHPQLTVHFIYTRHGDAAVRGHFSAEQLATLCPDWQSRRTYSCGPAALLEAVEANWSAANCTDSVTVERFRPALAPAASNTIGGTLNFLSSATRADSSGNVSILETAEQAGLAPVHGCRMGICHGCTAKLVCGQVRDLRSGQVHGEPDDLIQICVCAPVGDVQIDL